MSTTTFSVDSNVIVSLLNQEKELSGRALLALERSRRSGHLVVSGPVYAELLGLPARTPLILDNFFKSAGIEVDWHFDEAIWHAAGVAYQGYVRRRVADSKELPRRILTDFLIGAQVIVRSYTLLTFDKRLYVSSFPGIRVETF
jgi:predicted nucleic acid-binding protein